MDRFKKAAKDIFTTREGALGAASVAASVAGAYFLWPAAVAAGATMSAPSAAGFVISRAAFVANPQLYFQLLRTVGPKAAAAAFAPAAATAASFAPSVAAAVAPAAAAAAAVFRRFRRGGDGDEGDGNGDGNGDADGEGNGDGEGEGEGNGDGNGDGDDDGNGDGNGDGSTAGQPLHASDSISHPSLL